MKHITNHDVHNNELSKYGVFVPKLSHVRHLIESGALVYTCLDFETTDKDWKTAEITVASLTITDIGYNLISDDLFEVRVPDRVGLSPEALLITRFMASKLRKKDRLSPQYAVAQIYETVQDAPRRLWESLGEWKVSLGEPVWRRYVDERYVTMKGKNGAEKDVLVRHYPLLDNDNTVVKNVRVHEPDGGKDFMEMSYIVSKNESCDYEDEHGRWKIRKLDKYNIGFRNTFFDNRLMAAALFRANFPHKQIYAMNKKALGNHAVDVFTMALASHFFGHTGSKPNLGVARDPETSRDRISAKLDLLMEENTRRADDDVSLPEGVRVYDGTLHNLKRGHNAPDYDNAKSIGLHRYLRSHTSEIMAHIERCAHIDYFRNFMTLDHEEGVPTTHPIRFAIVSANDEKIYRAVPLITLGSDDQSGKFNRIWCMRADVDYETYAFEDKKIMEMSADELAALMRSQRGHADAIFHEIHLKRSRGVVDLDTGLRAGHCPGLTRQEMRFRRDMVTDYLDTHDRSFLSKVSDAFSMQYPFKPPADDVSQPYVEEEIWTAMGDVKYPYVKSGDGKIIRLPNVIREMAQDKFKYLNDRMGDCIRELLRPHKFDWDTSGENALAYARLRAKQEKKLSQYQDSVEPKERISLPMPEYPFSSSEILSKKNPPDLNVEDVYSTMIQDRLYLMDKIMETTRSYDVQQRVTSQLTGKSFWQAIPYNVLSLMPESRLLAMRDEGRLRIRFEENPNKPAYRFGIRYFMENGMGELLSLKQRDFYMAETSAYVQGPPYIIDPQQHRIMTVPKIMLSADRIRQNIHLGESFLAASRKGELGAYDRFINDNLAESILQNVIIDTERRKKDYPLTHKRKIDFGINPYTEEPILNIKYIVSSDANRIVVPDAAIACTASHTIFGHTCLVVADIPDMKKSKHIVLQEEHTKRTYYAAAPVFHPLPPRHDGQFQQFYERIDRAYIESGKEPPMDGYVLSCEEISPIVRMHKRIYPTVRIPQRSLIATRSPRQAYLQRDDPQTGFIMRKYDLRFERGQKILLRGIDENGAETGWEASAKISEKPDEITMKDLNAWLKNPEHSQKIDDMAFKCGFGTAHDMQAHMLSEFTKFDENVESPHNILIYLEVEPVKKIAYWTSKQPRAAYETYEELRPKTKFQKSRLAHKNPSLKLD